MDREQKQVEEIKEGDENLLDEDISEVLPNEFHKTSNMNKYTRRPHKNFIRKIGIPLS